MKQHHCIVVALFIAIPAGGALACGAAVGETASASVSESGEESAESSGTDPVPVDCVYAGETRDDGEEFATEDGCVTYLCDQGSLTVLADSRVTVDGDLALPSQADVDAQMCLGTVTGALTISGSAADLTGLQQLTRVGGLIDISAAEVVTLDGLQNLAEVGGMRIADNASLTTMVFSPYMSVFGDITIQNNDALTSLAGVSFIGQCTTCAMGRPGLPDGEATTGGSDQDPGGDGGGSATGEEPTAGGTFYGNILIADNDALVDLSAMGNLAFAWADVRFRNNASLAELNLGQLIEIRGSLEVSNHPALDTAAAQAFADGIDVWVTTLVCGNLGGTPCA